MPDMMYSDCRRVVFVGLMNTKKYSPGWTVLPTTI